MDNNRKLDWDDFKIEEYLGGGALGHVYKSVYDGAVFAVKVYSPKVKNIENVKEAAEIAKKIVHPNLLRCYDSFYDMVLLDKLGKEYVRTLISVMEYIPKSVKLTEIYNIEECLPFYLPQIISGLKYLHSNKIAHRDIKPDNILVIREQDIQKDVIKIIDYDFLKIMDESKIHTVGTPYYVSPEIYTQDNYTCRTDLWSLGVSLYYLLTRKMPYEAKNKIELREKVLSDYSPDFSKISEEYVPIVKGLLVKDPFKRLSLTEVLKLVPVKA